LRNIKPLGDAQGQHSARNTDTTPQKADRKKTKFHRRKLIFW